MRMCLMTDDAGPEPLELSGWTPALARRWLDVEWRVGAVFRTGGGGPSLTQWQILNVLAESGTMALMAMAMRLEVTGATVARAVAAAERRGWILKDRDPHDHRLIWLRPTPAGEAIREQTAQRVAERLAQLGEHVAPAEHNQLLAVLSQMAASAPGRPGLSER